MSFFALLHPINLKNQNFEKWKNLLEISSFCTCVPKITTIWCMVPEMWTIFCLEMLSFYTNMCAINEDHYDIWFLNIRCDRQIFVILGWLLPFYPRPFNDPKNQNFEKKIIKKMPGDVILVYKYVHHKWT